MLDGLGIFADMLPSKPPKHFVKKPDLYVDSEEDVNLLMEYLLLNDKGLSKEEFALVIHSIRSSSVLAYFMKCWKQHGIRLTEKKKRRHKKVRKFKKSEKNPVESRSGLTDDVGKIRSGVQKKITRKWLDIYERNSARSEPAFSCGRKSGKHNEFVKILYVPMGGQGRKY